MVNKMIKKYISNFIVGYVLIHILLFLFFFISDTVVDIFHRIPEGWFGGFLSLSFIMFLVIGSFSLVLSFAYVYHITTSFMEFRRNKKAEFRLNKKGK